MKTIEELFIPHRAHSGLFSQYESGDVAYVGNGFDDNSVVGYVKPLEKDKIFGFRAVVLSAFCEASVQLPPFVACGRAGNGLVILEPRSAMTIGYLAVVAAYINQAMRWRFNWYRQVTVERVRRLTIPDDFPEDLPFNVNTVLPAIVSQPTLFKPKLTFQPFRLGDLFDLVSGDSQP